jgi:steroid delta-isomerase-like uncharacterized protein
MTAADLPEKWANAWASGDVRALADLYSSDCVYRHPMFPEPIVGNEALYRHYAAIAEAFADFNPQVVGVIADGNNVAAEIVHTAMRITELSTPTGVLPPGPVETPAGHFFRLNAEGLIEEEHQYG